MQLLATSLKNQQIASPVGISTAFGLHWLFDDYFFLVQLLAASLTMAVSKYVIESKAHQQYHHTNLNGVTPWSRASLRLGALTGRGLGVTVHQHYGYRIHFELRGEFGSPSFER